jgi:hypothetical protein
MPTKKKSARKSPKPKTTGKKKPAANKQTAKKPVSKKKVSPKKATTKRRATAGKRTTAGKAASAARRPGSRRSRGSGGAFSRSGLGADYAGQSGDLQGLSRRERADSESVDELLEEGNAFEADVVAGVEDAEDSDEKEVRTHEVPEDDVPGEYLDKD